MGRVGEVFVRFPILKGVVAYSILWPAANIIHQWMDTHRQKMDWMEAARYGLVGVTFTLPVYYTWLKTINTLIPGTNFSAVAKKVTFEQTMYWPVAITVFYAGMNFYEGKSFQHFKDELKAKYVKTHLTGLCFWPFVSPITNYSSLVKEQNRLPIAATVSFIWASFLSYVKALEARAARLHKPPPGPGESDKALIPK